MQKRFLKNYLIKPKYQLNHALINMATIITCCGVLTYLISQKISATSYAIDSQMNNSLMQTELIIYISKVFLLGGLGLGALVVLINIVHTHRVFGSLYAIEKHLEGLIQNGKTTNLILRKHHQVGDLAELINELAEHLEKSKGNDSSNSKTGFVSGN